MARKTTIEAFGVWIGDEANERLVLERIAGGMTLREVSLSVKQPYTCLQGHFRSSAELVERYNQALRDYADYVEAENKSIADTVKADRDEVAKAKLQIEVRQRHAKQLHRERWGETVRVEKDVKIGVDQALVGKADELLRLASEKIVGGGLRWPRCTRQRCRSCGPPRNDKCRYLTLGAQSQRTEG